MCSIMWKDVIAPSDESGIDRKVSIPSAIVASRPRPRQSWTMESFRIDAASLHFVLAKQFQPFSSTAADVKNRHRLRPNPRSIEIRDIDALPLTDLGSGPSEDIFKGQIGGS